MGFHNFLDMQCIFRTPPVSFVMKTKLKDCHIPTKDRDAAFC